MTAPEVSVDAIGVAIAVGHAVETAHGSYFLGGSLASSLQGEPRATNDIDIVVKLPYGRVAEFAAALGTDFEVDLDMLRDALRHSSCCNIFYLPTVMKVDLFAVGSAPFDISEFDRKQRVQVRTSGETLVVKSPEDTVLRKLLWFREGGSVSERQWRDVVQVLRISGDVIDAQYLDAWALRLGLTDLLARARQPDG